MARSDDDFNPNHVYNQFPRNEDAGYNVVLRLNDRDLFRPELFDDPEMGPVLQEFVAAPFFAYYVQLKSSSQQSEWFLHKPRVALDPRRSAGVGIEFAGNLAKQMPTLDRLQTLVVDHHRTLAHHSIRAMGVIETKSDAAQIIHKQEPNAHPEDEDLEAR